MSEPEPLTENQLNWISETLARIRDGLGQFNAPASKEPAHFFEPEAFDGSTS